MAKILKARYYSRTSVVRASLGHNLSYVCRSILAAKEVVIQGSMVHVGSGHTVSISKDHWLPDLNDGFVSSYLNEELVVAPVNSLMMPNQRAWDYDVVSNIFNSRDKELIMKIPLSSRRDDDVWCWLADPRGCYLIRSCYKVLTSTTLGSFAGVWRKLLNLNMPNKVKNFVWRAAKNVLPTTVNLISKRVVILSTCPVCNAYEETILHSLIVCIFAKSC